MDRRKEVLGWRKMRAGVLDSRVKRTGVLESEKEVMAKGMRG